MSDASAAGSAPPTPETPAAVGKPLDPAVGMQFALVVDMLVRLSIWSTALAVTLWLAACWNLWPAVRVSELRSISVATDVSQKIVNLVLIFNVAYIAALLLTRLLIPVPKPGRYATAGGKRDRALLWSLLLGVLTKARYQAPFPAFLVQPLANIAPFRWLFNLQFGPRSGSVFFLDPQILDPAAVRIGRNVTIGFGSIITAHLQDREAVELHPVVIEDDVLIGGNTAIAAGVHIKRGAVIRACSLLVPGTVVGENEFWGGIPARRMREQGAAADRANQGSGAA